MEQRILQTPPAEPEAEEKRLYCDTDMFMSLDIGGRGKVYTSAMMSECGSDSTPDSTDSTEKDVQLISSVL